MRDGRVSTQPFKNDVLPTSNSQPRPFAGVVLGRALAPHRLALRWIGHRHDGTPVLLYCVRNRADFPGPRRMAELLRPFLELRDTHLHPILEVGLDGHGHLWLMSPYTGSHDGVLTLHRLLAQKDGGQMPPDEAERAVLQILQATDYAHSNGIANGPLGLDDCLVDRHGRVLIELYGVERQLRGLTGVNGELLRDELRSVGEIAYHLITGLVPADPRIDAARLVRRLSRKWAVWLHAALDEAAGFESAGEAIAALPNGDRFAGLGVETQEAEIPIVTTISVARRIINRLPRSVRDR